MPEDIAEPLVPYWLVPKPWLPFCIVPVVDGEVIAPGVVFMVPGVVVWPGVPGMVCVVEPDVVGVGVCWVPVCATPKLENVQMVAIAAI